MSILIVVTLLIIPNIILLFLICKHFVEEFFDFVTVFGFVAVVVAVVTLYILFNCSIYVLAGISHQNIITTLIPLISLTQFINLFQCFSLLIFLRIQTWMHVQIWYLLFGVDGHVLILFDGHFFVDVEDGLVFEC